LQQSGADFVPDERHQDQAVDAPTVFEPVAAGDRLALQTVQRAASSVQPDDAGQRRLLLRWRPVHRRVYNIKKFKIQTCMVAFVEGGNDGAAPPPTQKKYCEGKLIILKMGQ